MTPLAATSLPCPLCAAGAAPLHAAFGRRFHLCPECGLAFVDPADHLTPAQEAARYALHHNDPADPGYRAHLERLLEPLCARLADTRAASAPAGGAAAAPARALDYGSGPIPALAALLRERGLDAALYDPLHAPDEAPLARTYDLVACCEVAEHFRAPARDFARLAGLLAPGGWLGVMTRLLDDPAALPGWWYARDPTHVAFYQPRTMTWIARRFGWTLASPALDVSLFRAPGGDAAAP